MQISGSTQRFGLILKFFKTFFLCFYFVGAWLECGRSGTKKSPSTWWSFLLQITGSRYERFGLVWFSFFFPFLLVFVFGGCVVGVRPLPHLPPLPHRTVFPKIGFSHQTTPSPTRVAKFATNALSMPLSLPAFLFLCAAAAAAAARPLPYQQQ